MEFRESFALIGSRRVEEETYEKRMFPVLDFSCLEFAQSEGKIFFYLKIPQNWSILI